MSIRQRLAKLEEQTGGGPTYNVVIRWVDADLQAVGLTGLSDGMEVNRLEGESESAFQDRAAAILGGQQWQVPESAVPGGVSAAIRSDVY